MNIIILLLVILILIYGSFYKNKYNSLANKTLNYKLRIIGSNVELNRFYQNVDSISIIEELTKISKPNLNDKTIFVWPEGILPEISQESLNEYKWLFNEKFSENHLVIIGMNTRTIINNSENYFNSLSLYDNDLNLLSSYNKINLVPFGEFLPFETFLKNIGLRSLTNNYQSFSSGNKREII